VPSSSIPSMTIPISNSNYTNNISGMSKFYGFQSQSQQGQSIGFSKGG
jgi:hypothetical protein